MDDSDSKFLARIQALEQDIRAREDLLAIAAHELRNPMHALLLQVAAALGAARRDGAPADITQRLERIKHIVDRYVKRATVLLDVCRINANMYPLQLETVDIAAIAREIAESYNPEAAFHQSAILLTAPDALEGSWDRLAIEQILSNLVANAIKYGAGAPVQVAIEDRDGAVRIEVRDAGIGIAIEDQERIFGRFEQAATSVERRVGSGIGLWLARNLVQLHGGEIAVSSTPNRGSTFTVQLPRQAPLHPLGSE